MNTELLIIQSTHNFSLKFIMARFKIRISTCKSPKSMQKIYFNLMIEEI